MNSKTRFLALLIWVLGAATLARADDLQPDDGGAVACFEKTVRPILVGNCYACHSADTKPAGGLRVDDRNGLLRGGDTGPAVVPGDPGKSLLLERVRHTNPKRRMPKEGNQLTEAQIADLTTWLQDG